MKKLWTLPILSLLAAPLLVAWASAAMADTHTSGCFACRYACYITNEKGSPEYEQCLGMCISYNDCQAGPLKKIPVYHEDDLCDKECRQCVDVECVRSGLKPLDCLTEVMRCWGE